MNTKLFYIFLTDFINSLNSSGKLDTTICWWYEHYDGKRRVRYASQIVIHFKEGNYDCYKFYDDAKSEFKKTFSNEKFPQAYLLHDTYVKFYEVIFEYPIPNYMISQLPEGLTKPLKNTLLYMLEKGVDNLWLSDDITKELRKKNLV